MKKNKKTPRPKPRVFQGFRDIFAKDILLKQKMIETIRKIYEKYGFLPLETPAIEFVDILGKFLPESSTPQGGIFSFKNPDLSPNSKKINDEWLALRYDLTAPLARVVAQYQDLQKPFRRYQVGPVWRHEKPGPGRFREFWQFDFDSVGTSSMAADAEACSIFCETLENLGFQTDEYIVKVNNRKVLQGILEVCKIDQSGFSDQDSKTLTVVRAIDKLDRLGVEGVKQLLGKGRKDESGDFTKGAELESWQIDNIIEYVNTRVRKRSEVCNQLENLVKDSSTGLKGVEELRQINEFLTALGFNEDKVEFDPFIVRGMGYYTGPVYEGVLTKEIKDEKGEVKEIGSVFGGGRYDDLVKRFTGQQVPATGASIGVDRLLGAIKSLGKIKVRNSTSEVLITVMDKKKMPRYLQIAQEIRAAGINTEVFLGKGSIGKQIKYADKQEIPIALIAGSDEFEKGEYQLKDLQLGMELSKEVDDRQEWREKRPAQQSIPKEQLIPKLKEMLGNL